MFKAINLKYHDTIFFIRISLYLETMKKGMFIAIHLPRLPKLNNK